MLLPVADESDSPKNACSSPVNRIRSSARRLKCTMHSATACRNADTKSRSDDASMLLATTRENPRRFASAAVSTA